MVPIPRGVTTRGPRSQQTTHAWKLETLHELAAVGLAWFFLLFFLFSSSFFAVCSARRQPRVGDYLLERMKGGAWGGITAPLVRLWKLKSHFVVKKKKKVINLQIHLLFFVVFLPPKLILHYYHASRGFQF